MAYSSTNPPALVSQGFGGKPFRVFAYKSTHTAADVAATSFFANGVQLGMRVGDVLTNSGVSSGSTYVGHNEGRVSAVTSTGGATVVFASSST